MPAEHLHKGERSGRVNIADRQVHSTGGLFPVLRVHNVLAAGKATQHGQLPQHRVHFIIRLVFRLLLANSNQATRVQLICSGHYRRGHEDVWTGALESQENSLKVHHKIG